MRLTVGLLAMFVLVLGFASTARPCSRVLWAIQDGQLFVGGTNDWTGKVDSVFRVFPRGIDRVGVVVQNPHKWTSKYGSVILSGYDMGTHEGVNEKGLSVHVLFLTQVFDFGKRDPKLEGQPVQFDFQLKEGLQLVRNVALGADGKKCDLLTTGLAGVYRLETEKTGLPSAVSNSGPVVGPFTLPAVVNSAAPLVLDKITLPTHVIESPDVLQIEVLKGVPKPAYQLEPFDVISLQLADSVPVVPLQGSYTIDGDGTIDLGITYGGRVKIAGLTVAEAKLAVEKSLAAAKVNDPKLTIAVTRLRNIQQIRGIHLVHADGTIRLGPYGNVSVSGKSPADAKKAVEKHLSQYLLAPEVSLEVQGFHSKVEIAGEALSVMPPLRNGAKPETPIPPCIHEVLKKLPPVPPCILFVFKVSRDNLEQNARIVRELEAERLESPSFYPLVGFAHTHHATWKCTVSFTETITCDFPIPFKITRARMEVVSIPQKTLYMYVGPDGLKAPSIEPAKVSKAAGSVAPAKTTPSPEKLAPATPAPVIPAPLPAKPLEDKKPEMKPILEDKKDDLRPILPPAKELKLQNNQAPTDATVSKAREISDCTTRPDDHAGRKQDHEAA